MKYLFLLILYNRGFKVHVRPYKVVVGGIILLTFKEPTSPYYNVFDHAPKWYTKKYWNRHRTKEKKALERDLKGEESNYPYQHRKSAVWDYY